MSKAFTKESDTEDDEHADVPEESEPAQPAVKNYITPIGLQRLRDELKFLLARERPAVTQVVAWAAANGDRSENADYQYGKRRLRQIDRRIRFLRKRIDAAEVVDPQAPRSGRAATHVFFGATVRYATAADLIEFVKRHFESFVVEFGHVCLLFGREGQSLNPWSGIRDCVLRGCAGRHTTKNGPPAVEN